MKKNRVFPFVICLLLVILIIVVVTGFADLKKSIGEPKPVTVTINDIKGDGNIVGNDNQVNIPKNG